MSELIGKNQLFLEFDHWWADGPFAGRLWGNHQGPGYYRLLLTMVTHRLLLGPVLEDTGPKQYQKGGSDSEVGMLTSLPGSSIPNFGMMARKMAQVEVPFYFVPYEEFTGTWRPAISLQKNGPADFVPSWRRIWRIFQEAGATNVAWVIAPADNFIQAWFGSAINVMEWYPGDKYVDYIGIDLYATEKTDWKPSTSIDTAIQLYDGAAKIQKPFLINEIGLKNGYRPEKTGLSRTEWARDAIRKIRDEPRIIGFNWWDWSGDEWGITNQASEMIPTELTPLGRVLKEELQDSTFVETESPQWGPMPEYEPVQ